MSIKPPRDLYFGNIIMMEDPGEVAYDSKLNSMVKLVSYEHKDNFLTLPGQHFRSLSDTVTPMMSRGSNLGSEQGSGVKSEPDRSKRHGVYGSYQDISSMSSNEEVNSQRSEVSKAEVRGQQGEEQTGVRACRILLTTTIC